MRPPRFGVPYFLMNPPAFLISLVFALKSSEPPRTTQGPRTTFHCGRLGKDQIASRAKFISVAHPWVKHLTPQAVYSLNLNL
jgi:hypothetical protein